MSIYPNPTDGRFAVEINNIPAEIQAESYLYNMQGKLIEKKVIHAAEKTDFDLTGNVKGVYILNIRMGEKVSTWKIIRK